jgi:hypothetical protein
LSGLNDAVDSRDLAVGLVAVATLRDLVEELEELHVDNARSLGWSRQQIADSLAGEDAAGPRVELAVTQK